MLAKAITRDDRLILVALVIFTLLFRLSTVMMINTGVDERDYWQSARAMVDEEPYPALSHRTTRYGVILPVAVAQAVLGSHPNVYYVLPILNSLLQAAIAYLLGSSLRGRLGGFIFALSLVLFPYMIRAGSQVRPEVFSVTYMLLVFWSLVSYVGQEKNTFKALVPLVAWMFVAYETKITNLYFLPGILLTLLLYKGWKQAFFVAISLLGLFLVETALYAALTPYSTGQLGIITAKHFHSDSFTVPRLLDLFQRYSPSRLQLYWSVPFAVFGLASIVYLVKGKDRRIKGLVLSAYSFFFFITIAVKGLHPITPAESFINRYFTAVLVPVFLVLASLAGSTLEGLFLNKRFESLLISARAYIFVLVVGAALAIALPLLRFVPAGARSYVHSVFDMQNHPFALNELFRSEINDAYKTGMPIVAGPRLAGVNAIQTCSAYYLGFDTYIEKRPPQPTVQIIDGVEYQLLSKTGILNKHGSILAARRSPFRVGILDSVDLQELSLHDSRSNDD